jgi:hypothetical protein
MARHRRRTQERRIEHARASATKRRVLAGAGLSLGASLITGASAEAADFVVDRSDDGAPVSGCLDATPNDCNLRGAVAASNASGAYDYIYFLSSVTGVTLTAGDLDITDGVYIYGNGADATTISGGNASRIFNIDVGYVSPGYSELVNINYLTLTGGNAADGGAIYNNDANLNIFASVLTGNTASEEGGAIHDTGDYLAGYNTDVSYSTINGNDAGNEGGGFYGYYSAGQIYSSTISGNDAGAGAGDDGGGVYMYAPSDLYDSTVSGNTAGEDGGGVYAANPNAYVFNTILSDNTAPSGPDAYGGVYAGFSLLESPSGATLTSYPAGSNLTGQDPQLGPLQDNGGPTMTRALSLTSPVIDCGSTYATYDQRGLTRPVDLPGRANSTAAGADGADMGAFELQSGSVSGACNNPPPPAPPPAAPAPAPAAPAPAPTFNLKKAIKRCKKKFPKGPKRKKCIRRAKRRAQASAALSPARLRMRERGAADLPDRVAARGVPERSGHREGR